MLVKEIMSKNIISVNPGDSVSKFISLMEKSHIHEALVLNGKKFVGMIRFKTLVEKGIINPDKQKIKSIMDFPPKTLFSEQDIEEAAKLMLETGLKALPVIEGDSVAGIVSESDIINTVKDYREFKSTPAETIMSQAVTITKETDIGAARTIMREKNLSRLPVVDEEGNFKGIVTVFDLINAVKRPREKMEFYGMAAEMERIHSLPVSNIMNIYPPSAEKKTKLEQIAGLMAKYKTNGLTIIDRKKAIGIITMKDLLEFYVSGLKKEGVYYQVTGLGEEESMVSETIDRMIVDTIKKLSRVYPLQNLFVHIKKYNLKGLRAKYTVRIRALTGKGVFISKAWKWDPVAAVDDALENLENGFFKKKETTRTRILKELRRIKKTIHS